METTKVILTLIHENVVDLQSFHGGLMVTKTVEFASTHHFQVLLKTHQSVTTGTVASCNGKVPKQKGERDGMNYCQKGAANGIKCSLRYIGLEWTGVDWSVVC
jgi:hypothetical protein